MPALGIDQGLFSRGHCIKLRKLLGDSADLGDFAQKLIDDEIVSDVGILEKLANVSLTKSKVGPPANDPFDDTEDHEIKGEPLGEIKKPVLTLKKTGEKNGPVPKFAFETVALMDDASLAAGMRDLLKNTGRHGASDLHLTSGARPLFAAAARCLSSRNIRSPQKIPCASTPCCCPSRRRKTFSNAKTSTWPFPSIPASAIAST